MPRMLPPVSFPKVDRKDWGFLVVERAKHANPLGSHKFSKANAYVFIPMCHAATLYSLVIFPNFPAFTTAAFTQILVPVSNLLM